MMGFIVFISFVAKILREDGTGVPVGLQNQQQTDKTGCGRFDPCSLCLIQALLNDILEAEKSVMIHHGVSIKTNIVITGNWQEIT